MSSALLGEREELIRAAVQLEPTDRVPIVYQAEAFSPRFMGVALERYAHDPEVAVQTTLAAMDRLAGFDAVNSVPGGLIGVQMASLWLTRMLIPGRELPDDAVWQAAEAEDMTVEDYDDLIRSGWAVFRTAFLPRVLDLDELARSDAWFEANWEKTVAGFRAHDYVPLTGMVVATPFELLCGARSMHQFYLDLFRRPSLVKEAMRIMLPQVIADAIAAAEASGLPCVWVGGWRSSSGMLAETTWMEFVLPQLKEIVDSIATAGFTPILHFDHDWTRDLPYLTELPRARCILQLDGMTDIRRAKEVLGGHMCLMGDVPATLLATGTPADVTTYVRELIHDVGRTGFMLAPGCDAPADARPENMQALVAAGLESAT